MRRPIETPSPPHPLEPEVPALENLQREGGLSLTTWTWEVDFFFQRHLSHGAMAGQGGWTKSQVLVLPLHPSSWVTQAQACSPGPTGRDRGTRTAPK